MIGKDVSANWNLERIFPGGSASAELGKFLGVIEQELAGVAARSTLPVFSVETISAWVVPIVQLFDLSERLQEAYEFIACCAANDTNDTIAQQLLVRADTTAAMLDAQWIRLVAEWRTLSDAEWQILMRHPELAESAWQLEQKRKRSFMMLAPEKEILVSDLAADGYHAWYRLYNSIESKKTVSFEKEGEVKDYSLGQLAEVYRTHPDRTVRTRAFAAFETGWSALAPLCAQALNNQAGFRLALYRHRKWDTLTEALLNNRIERSSVEALWEAVAYESHRLTDFLNAKARVLGISKLDWYDVEAPIGTHTRGEKFSLSEAAEMIAQAVGTYDPESGSLAMRAFNEQWIESEDRSGKRQGGFCAYFPKAKESRVFLTFDHSLSGVGTIAHELGHAYHNQCLKDLSVGARMVSMSTAEVASTLNELILDYSLLQNASGAERLVFLDSALTNATSLFMNIGARYAFDLAFYDRRAQGALSVDELNALMLEQQQNAFRHSLASYHPLFWASKHHFYFTGEPFYNFPYTFGYLISAALFQQFQAEGKSFAPRYQAFLQDTGRMSAEQLIKKHLGGDLSDVSFWRKIVVGALAGVDEFCALASTR